MNLPPPPLRESALERARMAARAELSAQPRPRPWQRDALILLAATAGLSLLIGMGSLAVGAWDLELLRERSVTVTLILTVQLLGAVAAVAPRARAARVSAMMIAPLAVVMVVALRGQGLASTAPPWTCTVSHFGLDLIPAAAVLFALRRMAPHPLRASVAAITAGSVGSLLGELMCGQGARHVAMFHLPAWIGIAFIAFFMSRRIRPVSFAP